MYRRDESVRLLMVSGLFTADTALRLGKYFGVSPEVWLNLQTDYDLRITRRTTWLETESRIRTRAA